MTQRTLSLKGIVLWHISIFIAYTPTFFSNGFSYSE